MILTLNEERDLPDCLASVANCDDIVVLDSGSTDRTVEIARAAGARVFVRPFDTFAQQRNYAQREIPFRHRWVFHLDADERLTPEIKFECGGAQLEPAIDGFFAFPKVIWDGTWVRRGSNYPLPQARFVRAPEFEFIASGYGQREAPQMRMGSLFTAYLHDVSRGGEDEWIEKQRRHVRAEVSQLRARSSVFSLALMRLRHALPGRPLWQFIRHYVVRGGFLDGRAGFTYSLLAARRDALVGEELQRVSDVGPLVAPTAKV